MKKVIKTPPSDEYLLTKDASTNGFYGIESEGGSKSFIKRQTFDGVFVRGVIEWITNGNHFHSQDSSTLKALMDTLLDENYRIYEFQTAKELLIWLVKD